MSPIVISDRREIYLLHYSCLSIALFYDIFNTIYLLYCREILLPFSITTLETSMEKAPFVAFLPRKIRLPSYTMISVQYSYSTSAAYAIVPFYSGKMLLPSFAIPSEKYAYSTVLRLYYCLLLWHLQINIVIPFMVK
jgi:hypothetical protein